MTNPLLAHYDPMFAPHYWAGEKLIVAANCNTDYWKETFGSAAKEGALGLTSFRVIYKAYSGLCTYGIQWPGVESVSKEWIGIPFSTLLVINSLSGQKADFLVTKKTFKFLKPFFEMAIRTYKEGEYPEDFRANPEWLET